MISLLTSRSLTFNFQFSIFNFLGPCMKSNIAPASSMMMPIADSHCHGSLTISRMAYRSPRGEVGKLIRYIFSLIVLA